MKKLHMRAAHAALFPGLIAFALIAAGCATQSAPARAGSPQVVGESSSEQPSAFAVPERELGGTGPVFLDYEFPEDAITMELTENGSEHDHIATATLIIKNIPASEEGNAFTLIGGGLEDTGLHGPNATGFEGEGYHFSGPADDPGDNPPRDQDYKSDYTRTVENGSLSFDIYYVPTNINSWGPRYPQGTGLALTMMRAGTWDRVMHADNNDFNWSFGGIGAGNAAVFVLNIY